MLERFFMLLSLIVVFLSLFFSCVRKRSSWEREALFSLKLGIMEDEIDFFERNGALLLDQKISLLMKNGVFYVANPSLGKIMKFSSYGDILALVYNEKLNPPFKKNAQNFRINTWNFQNIGNIAVDSQGKLYIDDRIEVSSSLADKPFFDRVVLYFNSDGLYEDFLGRNGNRGLPFASIQNLQTIDNDKLLIVSRMEESWQIHSYDTQKNEFNLVDEINEDLLNQAGNNQTEFRIDSIISDLEGKKLFISTTGLTEARTEILPRLFVYDIEEKIILSNFLFPLGKQEESFQFIGVDQRKYLYFVREISNENSSIGYELRILNSNGKLFAKTLLPNESLEHPISAVLKISDTGIIYGLLAYDSGAQVLWWRPPDLLFLVR